jgi:hypothetical protein
MTNIGLHGDVVVFLKSMPEWGYNKGDRVIIDEDEQTKALMIYNSLTGDRILLLLEHDNVIYRREYMELRANWLNTEYKPAPMSKYRLDRKREHAIENPDSRTAEMMAHIDWLQARFDSVLQDAKECLHDNYSSFNEEEYMNNLP